LCPYGVAGLAPFWLLPAACCLLQAQCVVDAGAVPALLRLLNSSCDASQEAAVEALAALTQYSSDACRQLLQPGPILQQHQQPLQQPELTELCPPGALAAKQQQEPVGAPAAGSSKQQQQQQQEYRYKVLNRLLMVMKSKDVRLRYLCIRCISDLSRSSEATQPGNEQLQRVS
jgi:hypothetical protein